jgi:hypothetical protein
MTLFLSGIASTFVAVQPAFAQELAGQEAFDAVVAQATDLIPQLHVPGLAVGVIHGANCYAAGIGVTNVSTDLVAVPGTNFLIIMKDGEI